MRFTVWTLLANSCFTPVSPSVDCVDVLSLENPFFLSPSLTFQPWMLLVAFFQGFDNDPVLHSAVCMSDVHFRWLKVFWNRHSQDGFGRAINSVKFIDCLLMSPGYSNSLYQCVTNMNVIIWTSPKLFLAGLVTKWHAFIFLKPRKRLSLAVLAHIY